MLVIPEWKRRANLLSYFWSRVREENWCNWYSDPEFTFKMNFEDPSPIPATVWFEPTEWCWECLDSIATYGYGGLCQKCYDADGTGHEAYGE